MSKKIGLRFLGFILLGIFYFKVDWSHMNRMIEVADSRYLFLCFAIIMPQVLIKSERWRFLLRLQGRPMKALDSFMIYMSATLFGSITPGRAGELVKVVYLKNHGMPVSRAFSSVVVDRVFDLYFLGLIASAGLAVLNPWPAANALGLLGLFMLALGPFISSFLIKKAQAPPGVDRVSEKSGLLGKIIYWVREVNEGIKSIKGQGLGWAALLTIAGYAVFYFQFFLVAKAFQLPLSYLQIVFIMAFSSLVGLVPVTIAGIGTREATLLIFLSPMNIPLELILAYSMGVLLFIYVGQGIIGAVTFWLRPFDLKRALNFGDIKS